MLNRIGHTIHTIPNFVKGDIVIALIHPIIDYGNVVTSGCGVNGTNDNESRILVADS